MSVRIMVKRHHRKEAGMMQLRVRSSRFKVLGIVILVLLNLFVYSVSKSNADDESFIKPCQECAKAVLISNPEKDPLADAFLKNGVTVYLNATRNHSYFSFEKSLKESKPELLIYYHSNKGTSLYVGRYVSQNPDSDREEDTLSAKSFVNWFVQNAWKATG